MSLPAAGGTSRSIMTKMYVSSGETAEEGRASWGWEAVALGILGLCWCIEAKGVGHTSFAEEFARCSDFRAVEDDIQLGRCRGREALWCLRLRNADGSCDEKSL